MEERRGSGEEEWGGVGVPLTTKIPYMYMYLLSKQQHQKDLQMLAFWLANTTRLSLDLRQYGGENQVRGRGHCLYPHCNVSYQVREGEGASDDGDEGVGASDDGDEGVGRRGWGMLIVNLYSPVSYKLFKLPGDEKGLTLCNVDYITIL